MGISMEDMKTIHGFRFHRESTEAVKYAIGYKAKDEDIFLVTFPKTGCHYTYFIIHLLKNDGQYDEGHGYRCNTKRLELAGANTMFKPAIATHLPYALLPKNPKAQYICVFRNPKDTVVSSYFYYKRIELIDASTDFRQFFRQWFSGDYNDYFAHVSDYWRHRMDENFHYLVYEQMLRNPKKAIVRIAEIFGKEFTEKLMANNELHLNRVLKYSRFDDMKAVTNDNRVLRKGIAGDWRSHLTRDESDLIDAKFAEYFAGTELETIWSEDMKWL